MSSGVFRMKLFDTVLEESITELMVQKSRFITYLLPVCSEEKASRHLERIRKSHWDAAHHVPAWILRNGLQKFSDDGEPGGTAGLPVLESLKHQEMKNAMLVVVRYFGGVKLGTGGLVRAYGQAAREALTAAKVYAVEEFDRVTVEVEYTQLGKLQAYLSQSEVLGIETVFTDHVELSFFIEMDRTEKIREALTDMTHGNANIRTVSTELLAVKGKTFVRYHEEEVP